MNVFTRRLFLTSSLAASGCLQSDNSANTDREKFVCPPCDCSMDDVEFDAPGLCPDCGMTLKPKLENNLGYEPERLSPGAGSFKISGGFGRENSHISVHYYFPDGFSPASNILLIVPGAGRNSQNYRNAWLKIAQKKNILIAALGYPEETYDFAAYHLGGIVKNLSLKNPIREGRPQSTIIRLRDEDIKFDFNPYPEQWLFNDFDRLFEYIVTATGSERQKYDIFGHSAGGQILHRLALFRPKSRAGRIVAANAGFYTLPNLNGPFPTGLKNTGVDNEMLTDALGVKLTVLLGEADNSDDAGGILLHTPMIDEQGLGRLSRGAYFYSAGEAVAKSLNAPFNWTLETAPNVGHDFRLMSVAAAKMLFP